jgi:hypothetical protein
MKLISLDQPNAPPLEMPPRFRLELPFFITPPGENGAPAKLGENEYWINLADARRWLDDGVVYVVSPLDAENKAEIELTEDHELFLEWLLKHQIQHVRIMT